jgi:uncharacterized membrane protein YqhA
MLQTKATNIKLKTISNVEVDTINEIGIFVMLCYVILWFSSHIFSTLFFVILNCFDVGIKKLIVTFVKTNDLFLHSIILYRAM